MELGANPLGIGILYSLYSLFSLFPAGGAFLMQTDARSRVDAQRMSSGS